MEKKDVFLMFVFLGAIARDISELTSDSGRITAHAGSIPANCIPRNPRNAALVFLSVMAGRSRPYRWMCRVGGGRHAL
jgi:hypothetical protein